MWQNFLRTALAFGVVLAATSACATEQRSVADPLADPVYRQRLEAYLKGGDVYGPFEAVAGAARPTDIPLSQNPAAHVDPAALAKAESYARSTNSSSFLVWHEGELVAEHYYGETRQDTGIVSKSLAKPLTAIAVGRALALGLIKSLDQPVADFITEWRGTPKEAMLVRHLLDMRSGFLAQGSSTDPAHIWNTSYLHPEHERYIINDYPLVNAPGTRYDYSNSTSELISVVIERASGRRYADFIGSEVLQPIGAAGGKVWINRPGGMAHSGCCIMLPARTWLKLALLLLNDGVADGRRLLPDGYVREMRTGTAENPNYGLGVWLGTPYRERRGFHHPDSPQPKVLHSEPYLADDLFLFDGNGNQTVYIIPSRQLVIVRTGNRPDKPLEWDNAFLPNTLLRGLHARQGR